MRELAATELSAVTGGFSGTVTQVDEIVVHGEKIKPELGNFPIWGPRSPTPVFIPNLEETPRPGFEEDYLDQDKLLNKIAK